jgi:hypothetical protein
MVKYTLIRGASPPAGVRVEVSTTVAAYIALYEVDTSGNSKHIYPPIEPAVLVSPDFPVQMPDAPIQIAAGEKLRLLVMPYAASSGVGQLTEPAAVALEKNVAVPAVMVVDIPLEQN